MKYFLSIVILLCAYISSSAQTALQTENVVLITFDGLRWQELFKGADPQLIAHPDYVSDTAELRSLFWKADEQDRREVLMPFFWNTIAQQGQLYGDRKQSSLVNLTNPYWFSYPGYNEILTGKADKAIDSNDKLPNQNITILEYANQQKAFKGKVATFASWDVFPYIINEERAGIPVNAGYENAKEGKLTGREKWLNQLQPLLPGHWSTVRFDAFTHQYALEYLKKEKPKLLYISYGETDDFAHDGDYDEYLKSAQRTDQFIRELWEWTQQQREYKNKTTFIITTDHGRGTEPLDTWKSHGDEIEGADEVWWAIIGPDTPQGDAAVQGQFYQDQIANTIATLLGLDYQAQESKGKANSKAFHSSR
ncbi:alkaline phosphatase family protein [Catalinimonas niigatensis]|uniref:alkaline phosphatase family protein n=1 Tax=Catalinimonas niigatensis TaxID=1397264 RepID=UPI0026664DE4|nr:alkaline phosphatase family protein [Catalinimonas niigatensis]WPP50988.1 alkaline phosphatase family protein [Catalinimonas niigatensis]